MGPTIYFTWEGNHRSQTYILEDRMDMFVALATFCTCQLITEHIHIQLDQKQNTDFEEIRRDLLNLLDGKTAQSFNRNFWDRRLWENPITKQITDTPKINKTRRAIRRRLRRRLPIEIYAVYSQDGRHF